MHKYRKISATIFILLLAVLLGGCTSFTYRAARADSFDRGVIAIVSPRAGNARFTTLLQAELIEQGYRTVILTDYEIIPADISSGKFSILESINSGLARSGRVEMEEDTFSELLSINDLTVAHGYVEEFDRFLTAVVETTGADHLLVVDASPNGLSVRAYAVETVTGAVEFAYYMRANQFGFGHLFSDISDTPARSVSILDRGIFLLRQPSDEYRHLLVAQDIVDTLSGN